MVKEEDKRGDAKAETEVDELPKDLSHDEPPWEDMAVCPVPELFRRGMETCHGPAIPFTREKFTDNSRDVAGSGSIFQ